MATLIDLFSFCRYSVILSFASEVSTMGKVYDLCSVAFAIAGGAVLWRPRAVGDMGLNCVIILP